MSRAWLSSVIDSAARGDERPTVAALRLLLHENDGDVDYAIQTALSGANAHAHAHQRLSKIAALLADARKHAPRLRAVAAIGAGPRTNPSDAALGFSDTRSWAAAFDQAARIDRMSASALYAFGDTSRLAEATREMCAYLDAKGHITESSRVLEIGSGTGRILDALSPWIAQGVGIDISAEMLAGAHPRDNLAFLQTDGRSLAAFRDGSFDLTLAIDSFPYLVASGLDVSHVGEAARVLAPGGALLVMNYSYRNDRQSDQVDFTMACLASGLSPMALGEQPFDLWDGAVFSARKPAL
jgi:SAM-dependent methyltransferase